MVRSKRVFFKYKKTKQKLQYDKLHAGIGGHDVRYLDKLCVDINKQMIIVLSDLEQWGYHFFYFFPLIFIAARKKINRLSEK